LDAADRAEKTKTIAVQSNMANCGSSVAARWTSITQTYLASNLVAHIAEGYRMLSVCCAQTRRAGVRGSLTQLTKHHAGEAHRGHERRVLRRSRERLGVDVGLEDGLSRPDSGVGIAADCEYLLLTSVRELELASRRRCQEIQRCRGRESYDSPVTEERGALGGRGG
jgi:hypothetical protein